MSNLNQTYPFSLSFFQPVRLVTTALWQLMAPVPSVRYTAIPSGRDPPPVLVIRDTFALKQIQPPCPAPVSTSGTHTVHCDIRNMYHTVSY